MVHHVDYHKEYKKREPAAKVSQSSADRVRQTIEHAILTHQLKPRERLVERDLVDQFLLSRTPIREALTRLEALGLITSEGKRGYRVRDYTIKEILDLYYLREALERAALPLVLQNVTDEDIEECRKINDDFRDAWASRDLHRMIEVNGAFHKRMLQASSNTFLNEALESARMKVFFCRYSVFISQPISETSVTDHDQMLEALAARDHARYEELVISHMRAGRDKYLRMSEAGEFK